MQGILPNSSAQIGSRVEKFHISKYILHGFMRAEAAEPRIPQAPQRARAHAKMVVKRCAKTSPSPPEEQGWGEDFETTLVPGTDESWAASPAYKLRVAVS
jgi:hypothetical protein